MTRVEISFHDSTTVTKYVGVLAVVHGLSAVTIYVNDGSKNTHPWCNVQRVKETKQ